MNVPSKHGIVIMQIRLASMIANSSPRIKQIFEKWKTQGYICPAFQSSEKPGIKICITGRNTLGIAGKIEEQQKKNIALLFDMVKMSSELNNSYEKLKQMQSENGGFVWFKGGPDDRYITQYIVTGIGHLKKLKAIAESQQNEKLKTYP